MSKSRFALVNHRRLCPLMLTIVVMFTPVWIAATEAQDGCGKEISEARRLVEMAQFETAIKLLRPCVEKNRPEGQRIEGYELLALSYMALGRNDKATLLIEQLLNAQPAYTPDPSKHPGSFVRLVEETQRMHKTRCENALSEARRSYEKARFQKTIQLLRPCVDRDRLEGELRLNGYELLALSYVALFENAHAKTYIEQLLKDQPDYKLRDRSELPGAFVRMVEAQQRMHTKRRKRMWIIGAAAVMVAVPSVALSVKKWRSPNALPGPPTFPK